MKSYRVRIEQVVTVYGTITGTSERNACDRIENAPKGMPYDDIINVEKQTFETPTVEDIMDV